MQTIKSITGSVFKHHNNCDVAFNVIDIQESNSLLKIKLRWYNLIYGFYICEDEVLTTKDQVENWEPVDV